MVVSDGNIVFATQLILTLGYFKIVKSLIFSFYSILKTSLIYLDWQNSEIMFHIDIL